MVALFEQLWNGGIAPYKTCGIDDPEVAALAELVERNKAALYRELSDLQRKLLYNYESCCDEYRYLIAVHAFRSGFSLASRLLTDALGESCKQIN